MADKQERLRQLANARKADTALPHCHRLGDFHNGAYDRHDYVSPWTISAHNVDADLMILLQDWSSSDALDGPLDHKAAGVGYTPSLKTNIVLIGLIKRHFDLNIEDTYVTNLFVFIKNGRMNARIPMADAVYCAEKYAIPQIEIVGPRLALCVGLQTFNALRLALGERALRSTEAASNPVAIGPTRTYGVPHTGVWGLRNAGGLAEMDKIWSRIATTPDLLQAR